MIIVIHHESTHSSKSLDPETIRKLFFLSTYKQYTSSILIYFPDVFPPRRCVFCLYFRKIPCFQELPNCGTNCHPLLSLNPTTCHLLNLTSKSLILSLFLLKLPPFSLFCLCRGFVISPTSFPRHCLLKNAIVFAFLL